jgi:hypothetical protein
VGTKHVCFRKAILVGYGWYGKYYEDAAGQLHTYFAKPREMQDADPVMLHIVAAVRKWAGLSEELPYARSASKPTILIASRSKLLRDKYVPALHLDSCHGCQDCVMVAKIVLSHLTSPCPGLFEALIAPRLMWTSCRAGLIAKRSLLNEEDLVALLTNFPDVIVKQVRNNAGLQCAFKV